MEDSELQVLSCDPSKGGRRRMEDSELQVLLCDPSKEGRRIMEDIEHRCCYVVSL